MQFPLSANSAQAAKAIVREAFDKESLDNITATVVQFGWQTAKAKAQLEQLRNQARKQARTYTVEQRSEEMDESTDIRAN